MPRLKKKPERRKVRTFAVSRFLGSLSHDELAQYRDSLYSKSKELECPKIGYFPNGKIRHYFPRRKYGVDKTAVGLVGCHKRKLNILLYHLILRHQWAEVCGVLSVLLRYYVVENVTDTKYYKFDPSPYFWAAMEATRQLVGLQGNDTRFTKIYQLLYDKQQIGTQHKDKRNTGAVRLEYALYLMNQQRFDDARLASGSYVDNPPFRDYTLANLIHGLISYHEWFKLVKEHLDSNNEIQMDDDFDEGVGENEGSFSNDVTDSHENAMHTDAMSENTSNSDSGDNNCDIQTIHHDVPTEKENRWDLFDEADTESDNHWGYIMNAKVIYYRDLDQSLFPFRLSRSHQGVEYNIPFHGDISIYDNAVQYLKTALKIDRLTISALLPLVQLMLAGGDVKGAYEEILKCCEAQRHIIPLRIKSVFLESLTPKHNGMLIQVYEECLEIDPTYIHSIMKLTEMHKIGVYRTFNLLNRLAQHLDACPGSLSTWKQLVLCFEKIKSEEEVDVHPKVVDSEDSAFKPEITSSLNSFRQESVQAEWILRGSWWPSKHFQTNSVQEDLCSKGDDFLLYKAAACAHIFGPDSEYILTIENHYHMTNKSSRLTRLKNCVNLALNLLETLKTSLVQSSRIHV